MLNFNIFMSYMYIYLYIYIYTGTFSFLFFSFSPKVYRFTEGSIPKAIVKHRLVQRMKRFCIMETPIACNCKVRETYAIFVYCSPDFLVINFGLCLRLVELKTDKLAGKAPALHFTDPYRRAS